MSGDMNNNKMERFNGEFRDREKVMRGIKKENSMWVLERLSAFIMLRFRFLWLS